MQGRGMRMVVLEKKRMGVLGVGDGGIGVGDVHMYHRLCGQYEVEDVREESPVHSNDSQSTSKK